VDGGEPFRKMRNHSSRPRAAAGLMAVATVLGVSVAASSPAASCLPPGAPVFGEMAIIDQARAGGEPIIATHPDGTLLYGAHAGTTHLYGPEAGGGTGAFTDEYNGQAYFYWSPDHGKTWTFAGRPAPANQDGSGFSDPDFAIDAAGTVYISEINLLNVAMSASHDIGRTYELRNFFSEDVADRQWSEADAKDVVYLVGNVFGGGTSTAPAGEVGHTLFKSKDGGRTFTDGLPDGDGLGDLRVDKRDGTLYETHLQTGGDKILSMAVFRNAREDDLTSTLHPIAKGVDMLAHWPAFDLDPSGNLYVTWDESGRGARPAGVYVSASKDRGVTWSDPLRVDLDDKTDTWPWIAVGDDGRVAVAWLQADESLPDHDAETPGEHGWNIMVAATTTGLGCDAWATAAYAVAKATGEPIHRGTICQGGTACQAQGVDRRLGDYFSIEIDATGRMVAAYSDTRRGGSVALPGFLRQTGGPSFFAPAEPAIEPAPVTQPAPQPAAVPAVKGVRRELPATGVADTGLAAGLVLLSLACALARRLSLQR